VNAALALPAAAAQRIIDHVSGVALGAALLALAVGLALALAWWNADDDDEPPAPLERTGGFPKSRGRR
jgi:hypothetical protein